MRRRGFILFFGTKNIISNDPASTRKARCPRCGTETDMLGKSYRTWFTLFFLPIFPVSGRKLLSQCANCGAQFNTEPSQMQAASGQHDARLTQKTITMYNSLRNSPANSVTLNDLMHLYASMNEFDQAISAAREFPEALNNSEQCMTTLGRVYLAKHENAEALKWLEVAADRNPDLEDAQYFRAVAYLTANPPDLDQAQTAARAARNAGHPRAEDLIRDIQDKRQSTVHNSQ
jgi:tetratricopeptide (TPR) repeat protein